MKVVKPMKVPILHRTFEDRRKPFFHLAAFLAFPLDKPRALLDELTFWPAAQLALGTSLLDESLPKARGEVLVAGSWYAPGGKAVGSSFVRVKVGSVDKRLAVFGDRHWVRGSPSEPKPMTTMPIDWSHAFGGPKFARNVLGMGMEMVKRDGEEVRPLPNVERFGSPITSSSATPDPESFLPMDFGFEQRRARAGTYGLDYADKWAPGLPPDHQPSVWNLAANDQWIGGMWRGDERILVENMSPTAPKIEADLPGLLLRAFVRRKAVDVDPSALAEIALRLDTLWVFPSLGIGAIGFHGSLPVVEDDAADITHLLVACEEPAGPRSVDHYGDALTRRLDKDAGALHDLSDSDLMPDRASGVTPNIDFGPAGQWTRSEQIGMANAHRGAERRREKRCQELIDAGIDPARFGLDKPLPPPEPMPAVDDLDAIAKKFLEMEARVATEEAAVTERTKEMRATLAAQRKDLADELPPGGPPPKRADEQMARLSHTATAAREAGHPAYDLEDMLEDPAFYASWVKLDKMAAETYQRGAHLMPAALPMTEEANHVARTLLQLAREVGESLAERDFTGVDFRGCDLSGMDFRRAYLEGADLRGVDLSGAKLDEAVLTRADLRGARLGGASLEGANLGGANLEQASFEAADLSRAILTGARVEGATLSRARLVGADLLDVAWSGVDLAGAMLDDCVFLKSELEGANLTGASLVKTNFVECKLSRADFTDANLHKANFVSCAGEGVRFTRARLDEAVLAHQNELPRSDFTDARAEKCCLRTTLLPHARFDRAHLTMADLSECDLTHGVLDQAVLERALLIRTRLNHASLRGANLNEAILSKAKVDGADFTGAQLTRANFRRARGDDATRFTEAVVYFTQFDKDGAAS
jgi:uncharacterized protein YjbI with pentapeptide repeats